MQIYGDILQLSINDGYQNLAYKTLSAYAWIWQTFDNSLNWIIKLDDDLDLKMNKILDRLPLNESQSYPYVHCPSIHHKIDVRLKPNRNTWLISTLKFWREKLFCGNFHEWNEGKNPQFNFSSENLSVQCNFFKWDGKVTKIWHQLFHRIWKKIFVCLLILWLTQFQAHRFIEYNRK